MLSQDGRSCPECLSFPCSLAELVVLEPLTSRTDDDASPEGERPRASAPQEAKDRYWLHVLLFVATLASTIWAGGLMAGRSLLYEQVGYSAYLIDGLRYSLSLLAFLTVHEFGHYFAARRHRIATSLPYYIPFPLNIIGTLGAVIRIREPIPDRRKLFDVGAAGPLAGFVVALGVLLYALFTLPDPTYLMDLPGHEVIKEHIQQYGTFPDERPPAPGEDEGGVVIMIGNTLLYWGLQQLFTDVPPMYEMYHYPALFAGWLGLFFTALNLLPVGQLDGGHILYALVGRRWHSRIARGFVCILLLSGAIGFIEETVPWLYSVHEGLGRAGWFILAGILYFFLTRIFEGNHQLTAVLLLVLLGATALAQLIGPAAMQFGWEAWLIWCLLIVYLIKVDHPPVLERAPLTRRRRILGVLAIVIFILCFSFKPIYFV